MINALHSSRQGGTKCFQLHGVTFGWASIISLYERECERVKTGRTRMIPKLKEVHVIRDSWTKLNVTPAKILQVSNEQQCHITEMHYFDSTARESFVRIT